MNSKILLVVVLVLGGLLVLSEFTGKKERSFASELIAVDTAQLTTLEIDFPRESVSVLLQRNGTIWQVESDGKQYQADQQMIKRLLSAYVLMKPDRVAATSSEKWHAFEVGDSTAVSVTLKADKKVLGKVYYGKLAFSQPAGNQQMMRQQQPDVKTFVRVDGDERVYAVEGFLKSSYQPDINAYRNKQLLQLNQAEISSIRFEGSRNFNLQKQETSWTLGDLEVDSAFMVTYLRNLSRQNSSNFVDQALVSGKAFTEKLTISGSNFNPVEVSAWVVSDTLIGHVIHSSQNKDGYFEGVKNDLYKKLFPSQEAFLGVQVD
ncbi:MAG: DUF4340 domain-containing protein [Bacteroidales bacterium]|nr:DUF4340 domain-containing protein [Bacteroidales bacterium]HOI31418.1 DUF4340 domain-containing protein [Bacteroidales bacterium]